MCGKEGSLVRQLAEIKAELGTPYYESEDVLLYQGDCTALMERLSQPSFDLTMTSPPYNIGKEYERVLPLADYVAWCGKWMSRIYDLTLPSGSFWLNVGYVSVADRGKAVPLPYLLWDQSPFYLLQEVVWNYGAGVASRKSFSPRNEKLLWYVRDPEGYYFDLDPVRDPDVKYPNQKRMGSLNAILSEKIQATYGRFQRLPQEPTGQAGSGHRTRPSFHQLSLSA